MQVFRIILRETLTTFGDVEIMAEDEVTAREMALRSRKIDWNDDGETHVVVDSVEEVLDSEEE